MREQEKNTNLNVKIGWYHESATQIDISDITNNDIKGYGEIELTDLKKLEQVNKITLLDVKYGLYKTIASTIAGKSIKFIHGLKMIDLLERLYCDYSKNEEIEKAMFKINYNNIIYSNVSAIWIYQNVIFNIDGVDLVKWDNGNYGFITGKSDYIEILNYKL